MRYYGNRPKKSSRSDDYSRNKSDVRSVFTKDYRSATRDKHMGKNANSDEANANRGALEQEKRGAKRDTRNTLEKAIPIENTELTNERGGMAANNYRVNIY